MPIEVTLEGLYHRRKEAERFSQTATSAEARAWWTKEARAADRMIKAREKTDALNKQFKPPAIHLQGAFFYIANSMSKQVDILNNLILCQIQRPSARRDSQFTRRPIARIALRPKMRKAP